MDLPNLFSSSKKKRATRKFLALDITEEVITAGAWSVEDGRARVLKTSSPIEWQDENVSDAAEAADVAIEELGADGAGANEVVLGLPESWVGEKGIVDERKLLLKNLKEQLNLEPVGFVVTTEALVQYLQELEGGPISAVLLQCSSGNITISFVKGGKLEKREVVGRSGDTVADVSEGLTRLSTDTLPARMIIVGSRMKTEELEQEKQTLLAFDWQKAFSFFHFPKIETLPSNILITSVCISGGTEVAASMGLVKKEVGSTERNDMLKKNSLETVGQAQQAIKPSPAVVPEQQDNFGFQEVQEVEEQQKPSSLETQAEEDKVSEEELSEGAEEITAIPNPQLRSALPFSKDFENENSQGRDSQSREILRENPQKSSVDNLQAAEPESFEFLQTHAKNATTIPAAVPSVAQRISPFNKLRSVPSFIKKIIRSLLTGSSLRQKFYSDLSGRRRKLSLLLVAGAVVLVASVAGAIFLSASTKAEVSITLRTIPLSKELVITLDAEAEKTDPETNTLKAEIVEREVSGSKEIPTTGKKVVGDHAKGKVIIFNRTGSVKTFPEDTVLLGPNNVKFTLTEEVSIASSSSGADYSIQPGKAEASVISVEIGSEYNLEAKTEFSVANFDKLSYVSSNDQAFSGGSSREIQAVSKEDRLKLENELTQELQEQIKDQLTKTDEGTNKFIPTDKYEAKNKEFSADVNEEALNLTLTMTLSTTMLKYGNEELVPIAQAQLQSSLPEGAVLREEKTAIHPKEVKQEKDAPIILIATMTSEAIPKLDKEMIASLLTGKTTDQANSILRDKQEVASYEVVIKPSLSKTLFGRMPKKTENISIQIKVE